MNTTLICETHNYRDIPFYPLSGDTPECLACIHDADRERDTTEAYWASRSQCTMCILGGDCYRHGYVDDEYPTASLDAQLMDLLMAPLRIGYDLPYAMGLVIESPNYCEDVAPPF